MKRGEWARDLLTQLGNSAPDAKTVNFVATWTLGENTRAKFNPLATCQPMPGDSAFGVISCVREYPNHETGIDATIKTLNNGNYPHILAGLKNNDPEQAANALELGVWGTGLGFTTLWRTGDHTQEELLSHESAPTIFGPPEPSTGVPSTPVINQPGKTYPWDNLSSVTPDQIAKNVSYIALGGLLLAIALVLAIRSYVPTKQIVKTIAAA